jgi:hypothetical protein
MKIDAPSAKFRQHLNDFNGWDSRAYEIPKGIAPPVTYSPKSKRELVLRPWKKRVALAHENLLDSAGSKD